VTAESRPIEPDPHLPRCASPRGRAARLLALSIIAVAARVGLIAYAERHPDAFDFPDSQRYLRVARNIAAGNGPIEASDKRASTDPLYPVLLAVGVRLGLDDETSITRFGRIANAASSLCAIFLLLSLGRRWLGPGPAMIAAWIMAVDPILLFFNGLLLTETSYITLLLAAFACLARVRGDAAWRWAILCGILLGLATLCRSSSLLLPIGLLPFAWQLPGQIYRRRWLVPASLLIAYVLVLTPYAARNYRLFGRVVPVRIGAGASLLEAFGPWADGGPGMDRIVHPSYPADADEYERDRLCRESAMDWARQHPGRTVSLALAKLKRNWSITLNADEYSTPAYQAVAVCTVGPVLALATLGAWRLRRRPELVALLLYPAAYFTLLHMVLVGSIRYRLPAMPFVFLLAGAGACAAWQARGRTALPEGR